MPGIKESTKKKTKEDYELDTAEFDQNVVRELIKAFKVIVSINREIYKARDKDGKKLKDKDVYVEVGNPKSKDRVKLSRDQVKNLNAAYKYKLSDLSKYHEYAVKSKSVRRSLVNIQKARPEFLEFVKNLIANIEGVDLDTSADNLPFFNKGYMVMTTFVSVFSAYIRELKEKQITTKYPKSLPVDDLISEFLNKSVPKKVRRLSEVPKGKIKLNFKNRITPKLHTEINKAFASLVDKKNPNKMHPVKAYIIDLLYQSGADIDLATGENFSPAMLLLNKKEHAAIINYMEETGADFPALKLLLETNISKSDDSSKSMEALENIFDEEYRTKYLMSGVKKITAAALLEVSLYSPFLHTKYESVDAPSNKKNLASVLYNDSFKSLGYEGPNDFEGGLPSGLKMVIPSLMSSSKTDEEKKYAASNRDAILKEYQMIKKAVSINMPSDTEKKEETSKASKMRASEIKAAFESLSMTPEKRKFYETRYKTAALRNFDLETEAYTLSE